MIKIIKKRLRVLWFRLIHRNYEVSVKGDYAVTYLIEKYLNKDTNIEWHEVYESLIEPNIDSFEDRRQEALRFLDVIFTLSNKQERQNWYELIDDSECRLIYQLIYK